MRRSWHYMIDTRPGFLWIGIAGCRRSDDGRRGRSGCLFTLVDRAATYNPDRGRLSSWLLTITRRLAIDHFCLEARRPWAWNPSNPENALEKVPDPASQTEEFRWGTIKFALSELPQKQRSVIELAFYQGLSHSQIAEYQSTPLGTVKTRLRLGMEKLRREWEQEHKSN